MRSQFARALRATGITGYLTNKGTLETTQHIANHESLWTTRIYAAGGMRFRSMKWKKK